MLTQKDKEQLLSKFPNIKLSYETITHKKVYDYELILAIPCGIKCFAWFTMINNKFVCILFELENSKKKEIKNIKIINTCFTRSLCYGTIVYGTFFNHMNNNFFCIEDIFLYKNTDLSREKWNNKFNKIIDMLKNDAKQVAYNNNYVVFGLPIISNSNENINNTLKTDVKYKIHSIQYYKLNQASSFFSLQFDKFNVKQELVKQLESVNIPKYIVLEVRPDIQNDIYNLYCLDNLFCGIACIPDYKTSVMMNKIFRVIKENFNLDKLEESDDEDEFENPNIDKFVYLDKAIKMKCYYNKKFKKWIPTEIAQDKQLSSIDDTTNFVKNILSKTIKKNK